MQSLNLVMRKHRTNLNWETFHQSTGLSSSNMLILTKFRERLKICPRFKETEEMRQFSPMCDPGQTTIFEHEPWVGYQYCIRVKIPDFDQCTMVVQERISSFLKRKYALKYLGVKGHNVSNLFSNGSEKYTHICVCIYLCVHADV